MDTSYLMMLYVTLDQERVLKQFFIEHGWNFRKPDLSITTDKIGPSAMPVSPDVGPSYMPVSHAHKASHTLPASESSVIVNQTPSVSRITGKKRKQQTVTKTRSLLAKHAKSDVAAGYDASEDTGSSQDVLTKSANITFPMTVRCEDQEEIVVKLERPDDEEFEHIHHTYQSNKTDVTNNIPDKDTERDSDYGDNDDNSDNIGDDSFDAADQPGANSGMERSIDTKEDILERDLKQEVNGISQAELRMDLDDNPFDNYFLSEQALETRKGEDHGANSPKQKRFKSATYGEIDQLKAQNNQVMDRQTKWAVNLLREWMLEDGQNTTSFEWLPVEDLDALLERFYASAQTKSGKNYSKAALVGIRAGLNRHLTLPPISRSCHLMRDREFRSSNQVLSGLVNVLKKAGKDISCHREPIQETDINKLYESGVFDESGPVTLQNKVLFEIIGQFGRRGKEGLRELTKKSFVVQTDAKGRKFIKFAHHRLDTKEAHKQPRMYATDEKYCPVRSFEKYLNKLNPDGDELWQKPLLKVSDLDSVWYSAKPVGVNMLSTFMSRMSKEANLSQKYTNHCIRAYISNRLHDHGGFSTRTIIMSLPYGHHD